MTHTILVTGASGYIGSHIVDHLERRYPELHTRKLSRTPRPGWYAGDFADKNSLKEAMHGVDVLMLVSTTERPDREELHRNAIDAACDAGVSHIVYLSFYGAAADATFAHARLHYETEEYIRATGVNYTFLRDNFYTEATQAFIVDGVIAGPAGDGTAAFVARDDIAEAAAEVLAHPAQHRNQIYSLTGPAALSFDEVAAIASKYSGQEVRYHNETLDEARQSRAHYGAPDWEVDAWISTYTAIANGELAGVTDHIEKLTGHAPLSVEQWWQQQQHKGNDTNENA